MEITNRNEVLLRGYYYHIYNGCNNSERMFFQNRNYAFFLDKVINHLNDFVKIYSYCLLPDHFHFLLYIKELNILINENKRRSVSQAFSNLFNSYSKAINLQEGRSGNLFNRPFKRTLISSDIQMKDMICYIHKNPLHHGLNIDYKFYQWSSYRDILESEGSQTPYNEVLDLFSGPDKFKDSHIEAPDTLVKKFEL